ncbi:MAG: flagellar hook-length control protein FliK [Litorivicinaceae bacterium]|nr:flagellar hook-length control protein FliK [Litorivicinaceae bacterium]
MDALEPIRTVHFASPVREVVLQVHFQSQHADRLRAHITQIPPPAILLEVTPTSTALTVHPSHRHDEVTLAPIRIPLPTMPALAVEQRLEHWPVRVESVGGQWLFRASAADGRILVMQWPDPSKGLPASLSPIALSLETSLPDRLRALFGVSADIVTRLLQGRPVSQQLTRLIPEPSTALHVNQNRAMIVADAIREVSRPAMLIPDISPAIPRPVAPDALPSTVQVRLPAADELGLRPGQVIQGLIASSGEKMALTLNQQSIPLPPGRWLEGPVQARVIATAQGMALQLIPEGARQAAVSASGTLSPALAQTLGRVGVGSRPVLSQFFSPGGLLSAIVQEFPQLSRQLSQFQARSDQITGAVIAQQFQRNGLMLEGRLAQGVQLNQEQLKPWLRQLLQLLPSQHRLRSVVESAVMDLDAIQLEAAIQPNARDGHLAALLLWTDQAPVELTIERREEERAEGMRVVWMVDLHTDVVELGGLWLSSRYDGHQLDLTMWADRPDTVALARTNLTDLRAELQSHELRVGEMVVLAGPRPVSQALRHATDQHLQVDA